MSAAGSTALHRSIQTNPNPSEARPFADSKTIIPAAAPREEEAGGKKQKKRSLFGFGKKKTTEEKSSLPSTSNTSAPSATTGGAGASGATMTLRDPPSRRTTSSPIHIDQSSPSRHSTARLPPASPSRTLSSSPRLSPRLGSPAGSMIFERDVQEASAAMPNSPAIPSHIATENYIPPVLDASSEAITDDRIDPDSVEIITHTSHQPASAAVTGAAPGATATQSSSSFYDNSMAASWAAELASFEHDRLADSGSNYGSLDNSNADVRRLSFISFADVVQAEQGSAVGGGAGAASSRDSMHIAGLTSLATLGVNRSPSPIRSPVSSQGGAPGTSPPTSKSGSVKGIEMSPSRKPSAVLSPSLTTAHMGDGEFKIETMTQALRRTGSTDFSGVRSVPTSPVEGPSR